MAVSLEGLRLLQSIATRGSLSAAANDLGFTQSAASRQLRALEQSLGQQLVERGPRGARLTAMGSTLLPHAAAALDAIATTERLARGGATRPELRLGSFPSAGAALVPRFVSAFAAQNGAARVRTRDGSSPAMIRAVVGGVLDVAVVVSRPPFRRLTEGEDRLRERVLGTMDLAVAVPSTWAVGLAGHARLDELAELPWIGPSRTGGDPTLGVWPALPGRPDIRHRSDDWFAKLQLVAAGLGVTTVPPIVPSDALPGISVIGVDDAPRETRQLTVLTTRKRTTPELDVFPVLEDVFQDLAAGGEAGR